MQDTFIMEYVGEVLDHKQFRSVLEPHLPLPGERKAPTLILILKGLCHEIFITQKFTYLLRLMPVYVGFIMLAAYFCHSS
jgi:hypothetical protein